MPAAKAVEYTGKSLRDPFSDAETALSAQKATPSEVTLEILSLDLQGIVLYPHGKSQAIIDGNIVTEGSQLKRGKSAHHQIGGDGFLQRQDYFLQTKEGCLMAIPMIKRSSRTRLKRLVVAGLLLAFSRAFVFMPLAESARMPPNRSRSTWTTASTTPSP